MNLEEMQLAVCEKLPLKFIRHNHGNQSWPVWRIYWSGPGPIENLRPVHWPTEGLQVCHEAEKLLNAQQHKQYRYRLTTICGMVSGVEMDQVARNYISATYEQRLGALCHVWWPERFTS